MRTLACKGCRYYILNDSYAVDEEISTEFNAHLLYKWIVSINRSWNYHCSFTNSKSCKQTIQVDWLHHPCRVFPGGLRIKETVKYVSSSLCMCSWYSLYIPHCTHDVRSYICTYSNILLLLEQVCFHASS